MADFDDRLLIQIIAAQQATIDALREAAQALELEKELHAGTAALLRMRADGADALLSPALVWAKVREEEIARRERYVDAGDGAT